MVEFLRHWEFGSSGNFRAGIVVAAAAVVFAAFALTSTLTLAQALAAFGFVSLAAFVAVDLAKKEPSLAVCERPVLEQVSSHRRRASLLCLTPALYVFPETINKLEVVAFFFGKQILLACADLLGRVVIAGGPTRPNHLGNAVLI